DEEHKGHRAEHHEQRRPNVADHVVAQQTDPGSPSLVVGRVSLRQALGYRVHLRLRLFHGHAWLQARNRKEVALAAHRCLLRRHSHRHPDLCPLGNCYFGPHYANNHVRSSIEGYGPAGYVRIRPEPRVPKLVAENQFVILARLVLLRREYAPIERLHAKHRKEVRGDLAGADRLWLAVPGDVVCAKLIKRHPLKHGVLLLPIEKVRGGDRELCHAGKSRLRRNMPEAYQAIGLREGKRLQKYGVHHAEDGRIRANTERHDDDRNRCESGALGQVAQGEFQVSQELGHGETSVYPAALGEPSHRLDAAVFSEAWRISWNWHCPHERTGVRKWTPFQAKKGRGGYPGPLTMGFALTIRGPGAAADCAMNHPRLLCACWVP